MLQRGEIIRQSNVTWKSVSVGQKILGTDVYPNQPSGTLITQSNFKGFNYNFGQFDFFRDGSSIQYYPLDENQNDMGGRYSQTSVTSVIYDNNIKIQGTHSQKMFNNNSQITLMYRYDLQNLISGSRNWTIGLLILFLVQFQVPKQFIIIQFR